MIPKKKLKVGDFSIGKGEKLAVICGPCVIESEEGALSAAQELKKIFQRCGVNFVFKSSYDKANRSHIDSYRGPGLDEGLRILKRIKEELNLPILTDVHSPEQATRAGEVCDIIQIPAFLCRQTDLLVAAAQTGKIVQVKKGQFMAPWDMKNVVGKILSSGNDQIMLVDRGVTFGYNNLVTDLRAIPIMQGLGTPVCFDATHSVQLPGGQGTTTGGQREFILLLARGALAAGADLLYMEAHPEPEKGLSDASSMIDFETLERALPKLADLHEMIQEDWS